MRKLVTVLLLAIFAHSAAFAQVFKISLALSDGANGEPVSFATVSLTAAGAKKPAKYCLSSESGAAVLEDVRKGNYVLRAELLGYKPLEKEITVTSALDLGKLEMSPDSEQLEAAKVSATGNPIIIKKDTIEYNASSFKVTDNDVLEDLLKKLPGVEVGEDGGITVNGESVKKITIDGKTFFLDDPQLASKNIPAKIIRKLKVVEKKSDQAEFTGIDDGEHETVIDLSLHPGRLKGLFGNVMAGGGHDIPTEAALKGDWRYQAAAFLGKFTDKSQISVILNGNNTNNRGFNDMSGSMMGNMRGGGGGRGRGQGGWGDGNGITTSYMGGANGAWTLCDGDMDLSGNYLFNYTDKEVKEKSLKTSYRPGEQDLVYKSSGLGGEEFANSGTVSVGHRVGVRLEHKFSENTSLIFQPQFNIGHGDYAESSCDSTFLGRQGGELVNTATTKNIGHNNNVSTDGFLLFRQRLGMPGRTLSAMVRYSVSDNKLDAFNENHTTVFDGTAPNQDINQHILSNQKNYSVNSRLTYTEPVGNHFYVEANYAFRWARSTSEKNTFNRESGGADGALDPVYSNNILNDSQTHEFGANVLFQTEKMRAQLGVAAMPNLTVNETTRYNKESGGLEPMRYDNGGKARWNWAPRAMFWAEPNDKFTARVFYRGYTSQPSTSQLMPVPDNTDPLNVGFGNPNLAPYFNHTLSSDLRFNNKKTFFSFNIRLNAGLVQDPVVSLLWYNGGSQYTMPFNGSRPTANAGINGFFNIPIAKSNFSINSFTRASWSLNTSYVGTNIDMTKYTEEGYYEFMNDLASKFEDRDWSAAHITANSTNTLSIMERLRVTYRADNLELQLHGRTRYNQSWYAIATTNDRTQTFNNQVRFSVNWTWEAIGMTLKSDFNYNWYNGYTTKQPDEYVLNAEIQKTLFKNKFTLALKGYDLLGQAKNLTVTDNANYHSETVNNTLGRYLILSLTYRFGNMDKSKMKNGMGMGGGPRGPMR